MKFEFAGWDANTHALAWWIGNWRVELFPLQWRWGTFDNGVNIGALCITRHP